MDIGQQLLNLLQKLFGTGINVPGLVVGLIFVGVAAFVIQREHSSEKPGIIARVVSVFLGALGTFTATASLGLDLTDAFLIGWILVFAGGIWMITAKHGLTTLLGLIMVVVSIIFVVVTVVNTPTGSFLADGFRAMAGFFSGATHKK